MKKVIFADSFAQAAALLGPDCVVYGGGTEINRLNSSVEASSAVALRLPKAGIFCRDGLVILPFGTTFQDVIDSPLTPEYLKTAAGNMFSRQKRDMATVAGNLFLHRGDSYLTSCLRAAGAAVELDGEKTVGIEEYLEQFDSLSGRIISAVAVCPECRIAQKRIAVTAESRAVVTAAAGTDYGFASVPGTGQIRVDFSTVRCEGCVRRVLGENGVVFEDDILGSAQYKEYLVSVVLFDLMKEVRR